MKIEAATRLNTTQLAAPENSLSSIELNRALKAIGFTPFKTTVEDKDLAVSRTYEFGEVFLQLDEAKVKKLAALLAKYKGMSLTVYMAKGSAEVGIRTANVVAKMPKL